MDIYLLPSARKEMRQAHYNPLMTYRIIRHGHRTSHPGGSDMYTYKGKTIVGTYLNDRFEIFRFYDN